MSHCANMDDDEDICRVCRLEAADDRPLFHPCLCTGSIRYVHQDCLMQWLRHSRNRSCELCKHPFTFQPVYAESMPTRLGLTEIALGVVKRGSRVARKWVRGALVAIVWLGVVPYVTSRVWRTVFSLEEEDGDARVADAVAKQPSFWGGIASDCLEGSIVAASTVILFFTLMSLRDFVVSHMHEFFPDAGNNDAAADLPRDEIDAQRGGGAAGRNGVDDGWFDDNNVGDDFGNIADVGNNNNNNNGDVPLDDLAFGAVGEEVAGGGAGGMFGLFVDGAGDEVNLLDFLGFTGPVLNMVIHAFWAVVFICSFVFIFAYLPYVTGDAVRAVAVPVRESTSVSSVSTGAPSALVASPSSRWLTGSAKLDAIVTAFVGYVSIGSAASLVLLLGSAILRSRAAAAASAAVAAANSADAPPAPGTSGLSRAAWMVSTLFKVCFLMVCELVFFPLGFGWWLDLCTLDLFGFTLEGRRQMASTMPVTSACLHWMGGMVFMFHFGAFVSVVRDTLRPGLLFFLRDPNNPNFHPIRDMVRLPLVRHLRRLATSVVLYGSVVLLSVYIPVVVVRRCLPSLVPLRLTVGSSVTDVPIDLILFNVAVPFCADKLRPRDKFAWLLLEWAKGVGRVLGLESYLLESREDEHSDDEGGVHAIGRDGGDGGDDSDNSDSDSEESVGAVDVARARYGRVEAADAGESDVDVTGSDDGGSGNDDSDVVPVGGVHGMRRRRVHGHGPAVREDGVRADARRHDVNNNNNADNHHRHHHHHPHPHGHLNNNDANNGNGNNINNDADGDGPRLLHNGDPFVPYTKPPMFAPRVGALLVMSWATMAAFNGSIVVVPVLIGRFVLSHVTTDKVHEMYTFMVGLYSLWASAAALSYAMAAVRWCRNWRVLVDVAVVVAKKVATYLVIMAVFGGVLPLLLGLLFDCIVVIPSRVSLSESPLFFVAQDWALGVLYVKLGHSLLPLFPESDLKSAVETWEMSGLAELGLRSALRRIALPLCADLAFALALPYVFARGIVPALGLGHRAEALAFRHSFQAFFFCAALARVLPRMRVWMGSLYGTVRDDRYLIGRQLVNYQGRR